MSEESRKHTAEIGKAEFENMLRIVFTRRFSLTRTTEKSTYEWESEVFDEELDKRFVMTIKASENGAHVTIKFQPFENNTGEDITESVHVLYDQIHSSLENSKVLKVGQFSRGGERPLDGNENVHESN